MGDRDHSKSLNRLLKKQVEDLKAKNAHLELKLKQRSVSPHSARHGTVGNGLIIALKEVEHHKNTISGLNGKLQHLENENKKLKLNHKTRETDDDEDDDKFALNKKLSQKQEEIIEQNNIISQLKDKLQVLEKENSELKAITAQSNTNELHAVHSEHIESQARQIKDLKARLEYRTNNHNRQAELNKQKLELEQLNTVKYQKEVEDYHAKITQLEIELERVKFNNTKHQLKEDIDELDIAYKMIKQLQKENEDLKLRNVRHRVTEATKGLQKELSAKSYDVFKLCKEKQDLELKLRHSQQSVDDCEIKFSEMVSHYEKMLQELNPEKYEHLQLQVKNLTIELERVTKSKIQIESELIALKAKIVTDDDLTLNNYREKASQLEEERALLSARAEMKDTVEQLHDQSNRKILTLEHDIQETKEAISALQIENLSKSNQINEFEAQFEHWKKLVSNLTMLITSLQGSDLSIRVISVATKQIKRMLNGEDPVQQECCLNALYSIVTDSSRELIEKEEGLVQRVTHLTKVECEFVRNSAIRALWKIQAGKVDPDYGRGLHIHCKQFQLCQNYLQHLGIEEQLLNSAENMCFCVHCQKKRGDDIYHARGNPPKEYGLPVGWCRFGIKVNDSWAEANNVCNDWHVAFHGTLAPYLQSILEEGTLVNPGDHMPNEKDGEIIEVGDGQIPECDNKHTVFLSPSIRYSDSDVNTRVNMHNNTGFRIALQVRIKPDSYSVGPEIIGARYQIDPGYLNEELDWSTNMTGVTMICGILIKAENIPDGNK